MWCNHNLTVLNTGVNAPKMHRGHFRVRSLKQQNGWRLGHMYAHTCHVIISIMWVKKAFLSALQGSCAQCYYCEKSPKHRGKGQIWKLNKAPNSNSEPLFWAQVYTTTNIFSSVKSFIKICAEKYNLHCISGSRYDLNTQYLETLDLIWASRAAAIWDINLKYYLHQC